LVLRPPFIVVALALLLPGVAGASAPFSDRPVSGVSLAIDAKGEALVTYTRPGGGVRHVLVWGAVDALPPVRGVPQTAFRFDYAGGWGRYRDAGYWRRFRNGCAPYEGPRLDWLVAACTAPDGTHWALQAWRRLLPHRGYSPSRPEQAARELRISHWSGDPARLEVWADWAFNGDAHGLFGRLTYRGAPVHGFGTTSDGNPTDGYGRSLYIDTYDSAYGAGWRRETSIVFRNPSGAFCYSFWPTRDVSLPGRPLRPEGHGSRYRITVAGPGVTPDVVWVGAGLHDFDPSNQLDVDYERRMNALLDEVTAPDRFCPTQH
jgi:hypothetical protein